MHNCKLLSRWPIVTGKLIAYVCLSCLTKLTQVVTTNWRWWQYVCPGVQELLCHKNSVRRLCPKGMESLPYHCYYLFSSLIMLLYYFFLSSSAWSCKPSLGCLTSQFFKLCEQNQISTVCCRKHTLAWTFLTAMDHIQFYWPSTNLDQVLYYVISVFSFC